MASGLQFLGKLLGDAVNGFPDADWQYYATKLLTLLIGTIIVIYINGTVAVVERRRDII